MRSFLSRCRPSRATVIAMAALVVALSGDAYAAPVNFLLDVSNTSTAQTTLDGSAVAGKSALRVANSNTVSGSTALNLSVAPGHPPFSVSAGASRVVNLNADRLDGVDSTGFLRSTPPLALAGATAAATIQGTNTGGGGGLSGTSTSGDGVLGVSHASRGGSAVHGLNDSGGAAGLFDGSVQVNGPANVTGTLQASSLFVNNTLQANGATNLVLGPGAVQSAAVDWPPGQQRDLWPSLAGMLRVSYSCPSSVANDGTLTLVDTDVSHPQVNVFIDSGGANPTYHLLTPADGFQVGGLAAGDSFFVQAQGSGGVVTLEMATVHRPATNDCHAQAVAVIAGP